MTIQSSPESPQPLSMMVKAVKGWVERCGKLWIDAQVIEIRRRRGRAIQFLVLRDRHEDISAEVTCSAFVLESAGQLSEGAQVVALLRPRVWEGKSSLSYEATEIRICGEGKLLAELELRKRKLQAEGLFDASRKKKLPFAPQVIGLIAGQDSDAQRDVQKNVVNRWPGSEIRFVPALVQGPEAVKTVVAALKKLDIDPQVSVIIIARGGGSLENLLPFSDENLARQVASANTPIISAIGHEPDTPILDFVADYRASTPTDAAKIVVPDSREEAELIGAGLVRVRNAIESKLAALCQEFSQLCSRPVMKDPMGVFSGHDEKIADLKFRINNAMINRLNQEAISIKNDMTRIQAMSPKATLERGYAILIKDEMTVTSVDDLHEKDQIKARLADGQLDLSVLKTAKS